MVARPKSSTATVKSARQRGTASKPKARLVAAPKPEVRVFVSYSHRDVAAQQKLEMHLAPSQRDGVAVWYDGNIEPGASLDSEIARELRRAHIFVALLSPAYLASNYCWNIEYKRAMGRRARQQMRVVGVVVKPCGWKQTRASGFKLLPRDGLPPERWSSHDAAYVNIVEGIGQVIASVRREIAAASGKQPRRASQPSPKPQPIKPPPAASSKARKVTRPKSGARRKAKTGR